MQGEKVEVSSYNDCKNAEVLFVEPINKAPGVGVRDILISLV